jgi:hypothetical protein
MDRKKRKTWDKMKMANAIKAVRCKEMGLKTASRVFEVPRSTLKDKVNSKETDIEKLINTRLGRKPVLPSNVEEELVSYCLMMEKSFFGLTTRDMKRMAFELAIRNGLAHPFSVQQGNAGWKWLRNFICRHPQLTLRKPQATSAARVKGFTKANVAKFFDIYEPMLQLIKFSPHRLFNCDETGLTVVQHKVSKVISLKGKRRVSSLSSAERGSLVTIVTCMNVIGMYVPPLLVFPRCNMKAELLDGAPPGSIAACHKAGWIQKESFTQWFKHFVSYVKPSKEDPVILTLDGHYSHTRNIEVIDFAREKGVIIVCLPPHCTHKLQPLDVSFMHPLKTYYAQGIEIWLKNHPNRVVTHYQIAGLFGKAYLKSATAAIAANGFRKTGLFPCNRQIFDEHDFLEETQRNIRSCLLDNPVPCTSSSEEPPNTSSTNPQTVTSTVTPSASQNTAVVVLPSDISPVPDICSRKHEEPKIRHPSRKGSAAVLTSSPYKNKLQEDLNRKDTRNQRKFSSKIQSQKKKKSGPSDANISTVPAQQEKKRKRRASPSSSSDSEEYEELNLMETDEDSDSDAECWYCSGLYSRDRCGEKWIKCTKCLQVVP